MRRRSLARQTLNRCRSIDLRGADAGTLTGARRAAEICAANLGSHDDLVEDYNVLANTYDVFGDSSDTESETESSSTD